jgi:hypothetical protein
LAELNKHARERSEMHTKFCSGNLKGRYHLEDLGVDGRIILKLILKKGSGAVYTKFTQISIGSSGEFL